MHVTMHHSSAIASWTQHLKRNKAALWAAIFVFGLAISLAGLMAASQKTFAATYTVCASGCSYTTLQAAIAAASNGDGIQLRGAHHLGATVVVNKSVTISGAPGASVTTSGNANALTVTAPNVSIRYLSFTKTDNGGSQNIIGIQANNVQVRDNDFSGQYVIGDAGVSRAMVVSPGVQNFEIRDNNITSLRQPAYIDSNTKGKVLDNYVAGTRGWVVLSNSDVQFSHNTWGSGADQNVLDIAIIEGPTNNYPDNKVVQLSTLNDNATVENQFGPVNRLSDAYVNVTPSGNTGDQGAKWNPYTTITPALTRIVEGGTVWVANGTYNESFMITVPGTKLRGESREGVNVVSNGITNTGYAVDITGINNVAIENMTLTDGPGNQAYQLKVYQARFVELKNLTLEGPGAATVPRTGGIDFNATRDVTVENVSVNGYSRNGVAVSAKYASNDAYSRNYSFSNVSSTNNAWHGFAFYTHNSTGTVRSNITGVSFGGSNVSSGNGQTGIIFAGAHDPVILANGTPVNRVLGDGEADVNIDSFSFAANPIDVLNFQRAGVEATGTIFNGKTGSAMTPAERAAQDAKIHDQLDNAALGLVHYHDADTTAPSVPANGAPNGQMLGTNDFWFTWDASTDNSGGPLTYEFQSSLNPAQVDGVLTTGLWQSGTLSGPTIHSTGAPNGTWYWQVRAKDAAGNYSAWSPIWTVTLEVN